MTCVLLMPSMPEVFCLPLYLLMNMGFFLLILWFICFQVSISLMMDCLIILLFLSFLWSLLWLYQRVILHCVHVLWTLFSSGVILLLWCSCLGVCNFMFFCESQRQVPLQEHLSIMCFLKLPVMLIAGSSPIPAGMLCFELACLTSLIMDHTWSSPRAWLCSLPALSWFHCLFSNCTSRCGLIHRESFVPSVLLVVTQLFFFFSYVGIFKSRFVCFFSAWCLLRSYHTSRSCICNRRCHFSIKNYVSCARAMIMTIVPVFCFLPASIPRLSTGSKIPSLFISLFIYVGIFMDS